MRRLRGRCGPDVTVQLTPPRLRFRPQIEVHMTKRIEQSRRQGHHDPRYGGDRVLTLVPAPPVVPEVVTEEDATFPTPAVLTLLAQPSLPPVSEERVQL